MNKIIKIKQFYLLLLVVWVLQTLLPMPVMAERLWSWKRSLRIDTPGSEMYMPSAVAFDPSTERYYVVDTGYNRLVSYSRQGEMLKAFSADDQLLAPFDMIRLDNGKLWVVEKGRNSLTLIDIAAKEVTPYRLSDGDKRIFPDRIAYNQGQIHILDRSTGSVLQLNNDLEISQRYECTDCIDGFADFTIRDNSLWALETLGKKIYHFNSDGKMLKTIQLEGKVGFPVSLAIDQYGEFYILDRHRNQVVVFDSNGQYRYSFLELGQNPGQVYYPSEVRFDPWGQLCVVDEGNGRVEIYSRE